MIFGRDRCRSFPEFARRRVALMDQHKMALVNLSCWELTRAESGPRHPPADFLALRFRKFILSVRMQ